MELGNRLVLPDNEFATVVFDMTDFSLDNMDFEAVRFLVTALERYYPETLGALLVVNAPFIFWACWRIIRPWLDPKVREKIHFIDADRLAEHIDPADIPEDLGGTRPVPGEPRILVDDEFVAQPGTPHHDEDAAALLAKRAAAEKAYEELMRERVLRLSAYVLRSSECRSALWAGAVGADHAADVASNAAADRSDSALSDAEVASYEARRAEILAALRDACRWPCPRYVFYAVPDDEDATAATTLPTTLL